MRYIAIEGIDGSGKSRQARILVEEARRRGIATVALREPDGPLAPRIRHILHEPMSIEEFGASGLALLYAADREAMQRSRRVELDASELAVSDRSLVSSMLYQGDGPEDYAWILTINRNVRLPDLVVFLDVPTEVAMRRIGRRGGGDTFDSDTFRLEQLRHRVRSVVTFLRGRGVEVHVLSGDRTPEDVSADLVRLVLEDT